MYYNYYYTFKLLVRALLPEPTVGPKDTRAPNLRVTLGPSSKSHTRHNPRLWGYDRSPRRDASRRLVVLAFLQLILQ